MRWLVLKGVAWVLAETPARKVLPFDFTVVLARLLTPAEFGGVAMPGLLVGVAAGFSRLIELGVLVGGLGLGTS